MARGNKALAAMAAQIAERKERERIQREERGRLANLGPAEKPVNDEPLLNKFAAKQSCYGQGFAPDPTGAGRRSNLKMVAVLRNLYPNVVDRWLAEGGPGFDEPQRRAIDHVRSLWGCLGTQRLCANYTGVGGGNGDGNENEIFARRQLAEYENEIPRAYWMVFENCVRHDMAAGKAGEHLAKNDPQRIASAKATVGFIASKIAEWRGY